jgi:large subunit ribosomal protein L23
MRIIVTEKAVMKIESENMLTFQTSKNRSKEEIKKEIEELFNVKIEKIRSLVRKNQKYFFIKLNKKFPAIDIATKLGII